MGRPKTINKIKGFVESLGKSPDSTIARKYKVQVQTVVRSRRELKIPAYREWRKRGFTLSQIDRLLGKRPDRKIAKLTGMGITWIRERRIKKNIPAYRKKKK